MSSSGPGPHHLQGVACAPGRAAGRAWRWPRATRPQTAPASSPVEQLDRAWHRVRAELTERRQRLAGADDEDLGLVDVQHWLLVDPHFAGHAHDLAGRGVDAATALQGAVDHAVATLLGPGDPLLAARCADIRQLGERLMSALQGQADAPARPDRPAVLLARDLPADVLLELCGPVGTRPQRLVRAVLVERGGPLTHTALLARQRGIPVVGGLPDLLDRVADGQGLLVDGATGRVVVDPDAAAVRRFRSAPRRPSPPAPQRPAGLQVLANVDLPEEAVQARHAGADGIGLLRTDALLGPHGAPGRAEQARRYTLALRAWTGRQVVIRLFDAPVPGPEPSLGPRGVRWLGLLPERSRCQLDALCEAAAAVPQARLGVLAPMVSHPDELVALRAALVDSAGSGPLPLVGAMVETPAAALDIDRILDQVDFVAVGSNDLLQLLVGASREDPRVAALLDPAHPALWRLLAQVAAAARARGRPAILCGALAADPTHLPRIAALGFSGVSVGLADLSLTRRIAGGPARARGVDTPLPGS